jgi:hypothetical protein
MFFASIKNEYVTNTNSTANSTIRRNEGNSAMQATERTRSSALTQCAVLHVMEPSASGLRGFTERASRTRSDISLITKPKADEAAIKMIRIVREPFSGDAVSSAPKTPARVKRMPYASKRISLRSGW